MKNKVVIVALLSLAMGVALWSIKMLMHTTYEKPLQVTASTLPRSTQQAAPQRLNASADFRNPQKDNHPSPQTEPEAAEVIPSEKGLDELTAINEQTIVGTEWGDDRFKLEFGPNGKLLIGGSVRANWSIEGSRVKLYSNDGREVHWLDIEGNKLTWNGEPVGRFK